MITWDEYFQVMAVLSWVFNKKLPVEVAVKVADFIPLYEEKSSPFTEWQNEVLIKETDGEKQRILWNEKLKEKVEVPEPGFKFSELPLEFSPAEITLLRVVKMW